LRSNRQGFTAAEAISSTLPVPALTMPVKTAPGSTISRLPLPLAKSTAVPFPPLIVPALVTVPPEPR
jgi:hypothetical protein